jgi:alpha-L-fucosidase
MKKHTLLASLLLIAGVTFCQNNNSKTLAKWSDARFGMFIHWGPVTLKGTEIGWSRGSKVPTEEYDNLYKQFDPVKFNADEWVSVAKAAGMKYIVLTTKHHDGFCLWDTKQTDHNIMQTPFKRDVVKELTEACKKQGLAFGAYYSTCDWHHPDFPLYGSGGSKRKEKSDLDAYTKYLKRQIAELMLNYGPLITLWFDVPQEFDDVRGKGIIDFAHIIQPDILINSRTGTKGDYDTPEQRVGGMQMNRPWESCITIGDQWAWKPNEKLKSLRKCINTLILTVSGDGNLLFNVGPSPLGVIEPDQAERLKNMGKWLDKNAESIYGTRGGPFYPGTTLSSTRKDSTIYLHTLNSKSEKITIPVLPAKILSVTVLDGKKLKYKQTKTTTEITLPADLQDSISTTVKILIDKPAIDIPLIDLNEQFIATVSSTPNSASQMTDGSTDQLSCWKANSKDTIPWVTIDMRKPASISKVIIHEGWNSKITKFTVEYKKGNDWVSIFESNEINNKIECEFAKVKTQFVRIKFIKFTKSPIIREIEIK